MRRRFNKAYVLSAMLMVMLVSGAFLLPNLALNLQDYQAMEEIRFSSRTGIDYEAINTEYETDVYKRLKSFADGYASGKQYFITVGENKDAFDQEMLFASYYKMMESGFSMYSFDAPIAEGYFEIEKEDYYVIYDQDANNGAALLCWFLQVKIDDASMSVLIDAKDYTWYYYEFYDYSTDNMKKFYKKDQYNFGYAGLENRLFDISYYYGAEPVQTSDNNAIIYDAEIEQKSELSIGLYEDASRFKLMTDGSLSASFYYGENELHYDVYYTEDEKQGHSGLAMGIREIRNLLPQEDIAVRMQD